MERANAVGKMVSTDLSQPCNLFLKKKRCDKMRHAALIRSSQENWGDHRLTGPMLSFAGRERKDPVKL